MIYTTFITNTLQDIVNLIDNNLSEFNLSTTQIDDPTIEEMVNHISKFVTGRGFAQDLIIRTIQRPEPFKINKVHLRYYWSEILERVKSKYTCQDKIHPIVMEEVQIILYRQLAKMIFRSRTFRNIFSSYLHDIDGAKLMNYSLPNPKHLSSNDLLHPSLYDNMKYIGGSTLSGYMVQPLQVATWLQRVGAMDLRRDITQVDLFAKTMVEVIPIVFNSRMPKLLDDLTAIQNFRPKKVSKGPSSEVFKYLNTYLGKVIAKIDLCLLKSEPMTHVAQVDYYNKYIGAVEAIDFSREELLEIIIYIEQGRRGTFESEEILRDILFSDIQRGEYTTSNTDICKVYKKLAENGRLTIHNISNLLLCLHLIRKYTKES